MNAVQWNDQTPIFRQLKEKVIELIMDGEVIEGEAVPSVRQVAADYQINPLTVSKAYQELVDDEVLEKKRGLGMFVTEGAKEKLYAEERRIFLQQEWPRIIKRIQRLGINMDELTSEINQSTEQSTGDR
ncbi:GntR family transcriptional regulator [Aliikangiella maris]|uniref:GntR family transcriptional regulator n=2 Tax=Aliikangiella maris TaxID=3162458 RepID=A0ABV2BPG7_9GAMM